ncbi:Rossmann-like and DUF2520 domain-containing protein [Daejeonella sp. H1SJ63]|uniref:Rossmann-like and DUF2520 domain-containing protein n=1 Tax=Daejeonella sp. H1SJ63 TaxID=3034145 RepID=UPI0023EBB677|nr:Rossmann-like and DUF2520 domain-containing protein [Daejeonella sp. H1SJ63]
MKIVLLGSGNVATHLGRAFKMAGQTVSQVWSRNLLHAAELADTLAAEPVTDLFDLEPDADLYIISVKDEGIADLASRLKLNDKLVVHTSGTTGISALEGVSSKFGVFYPLQTFSKVKSVEFRQIPIAVEGNTPEVCALIRSIADRLSENVIELDSEQRRTLHISAVFACNFTNHLFALAKELLEEQKLDFDLLRPLIAETAEKIQMNDPASVQTGPAVRGDVSTMSAHLELLRNKPELKLIYEKLSQSIVNLHQRSVG